MTRFAHLAIAGVLCGYPLQVVAQSFDSQVPGAEFAVAVNLVAKNVRVETRLFVPDRAALVRAVIVITNYARLDRGAEPALFYEANWRALSETCRCALLSVKLGTIRPIAPNTPAANHFARNAALGGGEALLRALQHLGNESSRHELEQAPLVFFGWSATADFGTTFAELHPERTIGFIRYHTHRRGVPADIRVLRAIPALLIAGAKDETAGVEDAETLWRRGRSARAPWTFAVEPDATHSDSTELFYRSAASLIVPWVAAVVQQRVPTDGGTLRPIVEEVGWLGNHVTAEAAPHQDLRDPTDVGSWLPDEATARGWRAVLGALK